MSDESEKLKTKYPSVEFVYQIAVDSYDPLLRRLEAIDGRLQTILAIFVSTTAAILAIMANRKVSFDSKWFYAALACMVIASFVATVARLSGGVKLLDPSKLYTEKWLQCSEWEFKGLIIQYASQAFIKNKRLIFRKWLATVVVTITFLLGVLCLARWAILMTTNP
jgi:hypothetical protein